MTDEMTINPFRVTLKGQAQNDPWTTIEGATDQLLRFNLESMLPEDMETDYRSTPELIAAAAAEYVRALNAQPGISAQRDRPAAAQPMPVGGTTQPASPRPGLSSSLSPESDGNYWINIPYNRNKAQGDMQRQRAKDLGARFSPDDAPSSIPRTNKGVPERPWKVHTGFVSEENQRELLRLHETGFSDVR